MPECFAICFLLLLVVGMMGPRQQLSLGRVEKSFDQSGKSHGTYRAYDPLIATYSGLSTPYQSYPVRKSSKKDEWFRWAQAVVSLISLVGIS